MGLAERRIAVAYEKDQLPAWKKKIEAVVGVALEIDVKIEPLVKEQFITEYPQILDYNFFAPLEKAFQGICIDDLGKDALKSTIKKIHIKSDRSWSSLEASVEGNTLVLDADPTYSRGTETVDDYAQRIQTVLEKAL